MPRLRSVFDTNTYRGIGRKRIEKIRRAERSNGVVPIVSLWPVMELAAHLTDKDDAAFAAAWSGFTAIWPHSREYNGSRSAVR